MSPRKRANLPSGDIGQGRHSEYQPSVVERLQWAKYELAKRRQETAALEDLAALERELELGSDEPPPQRRASGRNRKIQDRETIIRAYDASIVAGETGTQEEVAARLGCTDRTLRGRLTEWKMTWPPTPEEIKALD